MNLAEFSDYVYMTWHGGRAIGSKDWTIAALGLVCEAGETADALKKIVRDGDNEQTRAKLIEEMGDMLYYFQWIMQTHKVTWGEIIDANVSKVDERYGRKPKE